MVSIVLTPGDLLGVLNVNSRVIERRCEATGCVPETDAEEKDRAECGVSHRSLIPREPTRATHVLRLFTPLPSWRRLGAGLIVRRLRIFPLPSWEGVRGRGHFNLPRSFPTPLDRIFLLRGAFGCSLSLVRKEGREFLRGFS